MSLAGSIVFSTVDIAGVDNATTLTVQRGASISTDGLGMKTGKGKTAGREAVSIEGHRLFLIPNLKDYVRLPEAVLETYAGELQQNHPNVKSGGGSGAGHGGEGADGCGPWGGSGGLAFGSLGLPFDLGSGGAAGSIPLQGGRGGGRVRVRWPGLLRIDGRVSANGQNGTCSYRLAKNVTMKEYSGGGGAGGSVQIIANQIRGRGLLEATGGHSPKKCNLWDLFSGGGGGGGGRLAVLAFRNDAAFKVLMQGGESGGEHCMAAGAGTFFRGLLTDPFDRYDR